MEPEVLLILIATTAAVVGTLWNANKWGKAIIVALAVTTAGASALEAQQNAIEKEKAEADAEEARRNVEMILTAVQPPGVFHTAINKAFERACKELRMSPVSQHYSERYGRILFFGKLDDHSKSSGILHIAPIQQQDLFLKFARNEDLVPHLLDLANGKWGNDNLEDPNDFSEIVDHLVDLSSFLLSNSLGGKDFRSEMSRKNMTVSISFNLPDGRRMHKAVHFDRDFMLSLLEVPPIERGRLIFIRVKKQAGLR